MSSLQKLNIAIVGGGVCGLTLALALQKKGLKAHIYEAASKFGEIGAGLGIAANALSILREIDVYEEITKYMPDPTKLNIPGIRCVLGSEGHDLLYNIRTNGKRSAAAIHRATFLNALVQFVDPSYTHFNKRCVSVSRAEGSHHAQVIRFSDGSIAEADLVLVANGINSPVRGVVMSDGGVDEQALGSKEAKAAIQGVAYSNTACYRGLVRKDQAEALGVDTSMWQYPINLIGKNKHVIVYPINNGQLINIVAYISDHSNPVGSVHLPLSHPLSQTVTSDELLAEFPAPDFSDDVRNLLRCIDQPSKWSINIVYPHLETYSRGRVALLGDAAHGMLPHLGSGAGQGIEDAYLLAQLLSHPQTTNVNVEAVLQVYSDLRRPRSQRILDLSLQTGLVYDGWGSRGFTREGLTEDLKEIEEWMDEAHSYTLGKDADEATALLKQRGVFA